MTPKQNESTKMGTSGSQEPSVAPLVMACKRKRGDGGNTTPNLVSPSPTEEDDEIENLKTTKRQRQCNRNEQAQSPLFSELPEDVLHHVLSFLTDVEERHSLQLTCSSFRTMSNNPNMMRSLNLCGENESAGRSILDSIDTPEQAIEGLFEFARASNLRALYM